MDEMENAAAGKNRRRTRLHHRPAPPPAGRQCTSLDVSQFQTSPQRRKLFPTDYVHDSNMVPSNLSNFALSSVASLGKYRMLRSSILCVHAISTRAEKKLKITKNIENTFVWKTVEEGWVLDKNMSMETNTCATSFRSYKSADGWPAGGVQPALYYIHQAGRDTEDVPRWFFHVVRSIDVWLPRSIGR